MIKPGNNYNRSKNGWFLKIWIENMVYVCKTYKLILKYNFLEIVF